MNSPGPSNARPGLKHPGRWLWIFLLVPVVLGLVRLRFDVEVFDLLPDKLPVVQGLKIYQQYFANARELLITIQAGQAEAAEAAARAIADKLRPQTNLVASVTWEPPWLEHPDQAAELLAYLWFNQPPEVFGELTNRLAPDKLAETLNATREQLATSLSPQDIARLSYDPFGLTQLPESAAGAAPSFVGAQEGFSSPDGQFRLVFVLARPALQNYRECEHWLNSVRADAAAAVKPWPGVKLGYTGRPAFVAEIAGGMEHDITTSVGGTAIIIAVLFWLAHRRIKPMLWLLTLLAIILGSTLALGGLIYGTINVVSMGFAAILLGLAVDYAVVHYQEALAHPGLTIPQIRHAIAPSIFWAAVTTIAAFLVLNFGGLPGLGQLGTLVGLGVALAATIMIFEFLPPLFPGRGEGGARNPAVPGRSGDQSGLLADGTEERSPLRPGTTAHHDTPPETAITSRVSPLRRALVFGATAALVIFTVVVLALRFPVIDPTANALRPRHSAAYEAVDEIQTRLSQTREPLWLLNGGTSVAEVREKLEREQAVLSRAVTNGLIAGFRLPTPLWPSPADQAANRPLAAMVAGERQALREAAQTNGFSGNALGLTERMLDTWRVAASSTGVFWPTNPMSQWILSKFAVRTPTNFFALGLVNPTKTGALGSTETRLAKVESDLPRDRVWLSGWELLGASIFNLVKTNMWKVLAPMLVLVMLSLFLAFKRAPEILLSLGVLGLSALTLLTIMRLVGWSWNLLNLMAIPLVLGTGVDYSIFMQLALRRHHGDLRIAYQSVGRALLLCGGTAIAGFGSLAWSSNAGMASLGRVCAIGIGSNMLFAIFLLPVWWHAVLARRRLASVPAAGDTASAAVVPGPDHQLSAPSSLYRQEFWRLGLWLIRLLTPAVCASLSRAFVTLYWHLARHRRQVVIENLLPALKGDSAAARNTARRLFQQFALKVVDLWRWEAGLPLDSLFGQTSGWEHFLRAQAEKKGILLVTPHLGNWEFGGPSLSRKGVALQVVTQAEPGQHFTELRQASRARWNIETLVIGDDPFAFLEIIRRLEAGATVALLIDRPPASTATNVELFGRPFPASLAAAELARASGCTVLPVYLPREGNAYGAHILPPVTYDRPSLRDRAARQQFTQTIIRAFEPVILSHLEQWFQFVPVWPSATKPPEPSA